MDDDPEKQRHQLHGLRVLGPARDTAEICEEHGVAEVLIAMPNATGQKVRELVQAATQAGVKTRTLPGISDIMSGRFDPFALRQVEIQDLLRREPRQDSDLEQVQDLATERTVLVTGAGGSIGAELCRQICGLEPRQLILLGHGENSIFGIQRELAQRFPHLMVEAVIADVKDGAQMQRVFERWEPFTVFHAAAHKHVPLMEDNLAEAVTNNVLGTRNVVEAAARGASTRPRLHRQGGPSDQRHGRHQASGRAARPDHGGRAGPELRGGALRQRAGQPGAAWCRFPAADRATAGRSR